MKIPDKYKGRYFYHFTHIENLDSIVKNGLLSTNKKNKLGITHVNLASESIQLRRSEMDVTCSPKGKIHDYTPFYFTARNPMLLGVLNRKNIDQPLIIYIAISIEKLIEKNVVFSDASANTLEPPNFYNDPSDLDKLSWDLIDSQKWKMQSDDDLHKRMAEVLIYEEMSIDWIDKIVIYNDVVKKEIEKVYEENKVKLPEITYQPINGKYFYFTKKYVFATSDRENETLVTGPYFMKHYFESAINTVIEARKNSKEKKFVFDNISDALTKINNDFSVIQELNDIYELETQNEVHTENVSDHTKSVVEKLEQNTYYTTLDETDKSIVKLSAYLHDIGKGPKSKWKGGKQNAYPDHPKDAIPMLERILSEDFENITQYEIRKVCLLVAYHDLVGDILERNRSRKEIIDLGIDEKELNMLIALSLADTSAINSGWNFMIEMKLPNFVKEIKEEICK